MLIILLYIKEKIKMNKIYKTLEEIKINYPEKEIGRAKNLIG